MNEIATRLERGELTLERVRLASFLGDEEARKIVPTEESDEELDFWTRGIPHFTKEVRVRIAIAAAEAVMHLLPEPPPSLAAVFPTNVQLS